MDIIIRDVEEKDGQYKIYNKDGTGGHWYITKESAEQVSGQIEPQVMRKIAEVKNEFIKRFCDITEEPINTDNLSCGEWIRLTNSGWEPDPKKLVQTTKYIKMKNVSPYRILDFIVETLSNFTA